MKFWSKNIENWRSWKIDIFFVSCFGYWVFQKKCFFINEKTKGFHMRYHSFLHYGWFLQNLGKDFIPTNMHTTVLPMTNQLITSSQDESLKLKWWLMLFIPNLRVQQLMQSDGGIFFSSVSFLHFPGSVQWPHFVVDKHETPNLHHFCTFQHSCKKMQFLLQF